MRQRQEEYGDSRGRGDYEGVVTRGLREGRYMELGSREGDLEDDRERIEESMRK